MRRSMELGAVFLTSLALLAGSAYAAFRETVPFLAMPADPDARIAFLAGPLMQPGMSYRSKQTTMNDCAMSMTGMAILSYDPTTSDRIYENCGALAAGIVGTMPTFSYAWYVRALSLGTDAGFEDALLEARRTSPNQEGVTYYRMLLAYDHWDQLSEAARTTLTQDLAVLARSARGRAWMARRYLADPSFGETILAKMETLSPNIQRSFLSAVSAAGG